MRRLRTWPEVAAELPKIAPDISRAEFARRCGISESTISKGLRNGSRMHGPMAGTVNDKLAELAAERAIGGAAE